jgi:molecular chaperone GrpE
MKWRRNKESMDQQQNRDQAIEDPNALDGSDEQIASIEKDLQDARDQLLRRTAEMENMRRRHQQEREQWILESNRNLILALLPTLDDLERTLEHAAEAQDPLTQGIELVHKNLIKTLERFGVRPMLVVGQQFDPQQHDALMQEARNDAEPGSITREIQKGYMLGEKVLRHAKVFVAQEQENV